MIHRKIVLFLFRLIVGGVFIWAGILKIIDPLGFAQDIKNFRIISQDMSFFIALVLPWIEVLSGVFLISGIYRRSSALLLSILLLGFMALVTITMIRGIDTECGCFGSLSHKANFWLIIQDSLLCLLSLSSFFSKSDTIALFQKRRG